MPVLPSMRSSCVAIVAGLAAASAPACKPAYHLPRGFEVGQPIEVSANGAATLHLPANARGWSWWPPSSLRPAPKFIEARRPPARRLPHSEWWSSKTIGTIACW